MIRVKALVHWVIGLFSASLCCAGVVNLEPTRLVFSNEEPVVTLHVSNPSDAKITMQLQLFRWSMQKDKNIYSPSDDIIISPPLFSIAAHQAQVVRFALSQPNLHGAMQRTYRLSLLEVLPDPKTLPEAEKEKQLRIALQVLMPIFIEPKTRAENFVWLTRKLDGERYQVTLKNTGNVTLFLDAWQMLSNNKVVAEQKKQFVYVLPQHEFQWQVPIATNASSVDISAHINNETVMKRGQKL